MARHPAMRSRTSSDSGDEEQPPGGGKPAKAAIPLTRKRRGRSAWMRPQVYNPDTLSCEYQ